jgi:hypothetical protein
MQKSCVLQGKSLGSIVMTYHIIPLQLLFAGRNRQAQARRTRFFESR